MGVTGYAIDPRLSEGTASEFCERFGFAGDRYRNGGNRSGNFELSYPDRTSGQTSSVRDSLDHRRCLPVVFTGRYEQKVGISFRNAYILAIQELPVTLALALINLGYPALFLMIPEALLSGYLFCLLFFFFATSACLSAGLLLHTLKKSQA